MFPSIKSNHLALQNPNSYSKLKYFIYTALLKMHYEGHKHKWIRYLSTDKQSIGMSLSGTGRQHRRHSISQNVRPAGIIPLFLSKRSSNETEHRGDAWLWQNDTFNSSIMKVNKKCDNLHFMYFCTSWALRYAEICSSQRKRL